MQKDPSNASLPFTVPRLTIGSFSSSSRPEAQLHFTLGLMESILVRCRDLMGADHGAEGYTRPQGGFSVLRGSKDGHRARSGRPAGNAHSRGDASEARG